MWPTKSEIVDKVRLLLDEIGTNDADFESGKDDQELNTLIENLALEALRFVNLNAPVELLEADVLLSSPPPLGDPQLFSRVGGVLPGTEIGVFSPVENFLRLICVRCSAWSKPAYDAVSEGSPSWDKLRNKYLTGTVEDPCVSVEKVKSYDSVEDFEKTELRLYCIPSDATDITVNAFYMERPAWKANDSIHVSFLLQDAFYYYLTYLVLMALDDKRAKVALEQALPLMGMSTQKSGGNGE